MFRCNFHHSQFGVQCVSIVRPLCTVFVVWSAILLGSLTVDFPVICDLVLSMAQQRILRSGKDAKCEQRFVIKHFTLSDETTINICTHLRRIHGTQTLSQTAVCNWYKHFKSNNPQATCLDRPHCGGPCTARKQRNIDCVCRIIAQDRRITVHNVALQVHVSVGSAHKTIWEDLKLKKIAVHFVPKLLTEEQHAQHV